MALRIHQIKSEQWIGTEWVVEKDNKVIYSAGAEEGKLFGREWCWLWVIFHPRVW